MNERLKAWCERRLWTGSDRHIAYHTSNYALQADGTHRDTNPINLYVTKKPNQSDLRFGRPPWYLTGSSMHPDHNESHFCHYLQGDPTPEKCEAICSLLSLPLKDGRADGHHDPVVLLACHALAAADGLDPTTALALADEIQQRFRYPDITIEWLREIGWESRGVPHWTHQHWPLRFVKLMPVGYPPTSWRWCLDSLGRTASGVLAHRGDLLKLMELFGHNWKNPPEVRRPETFTNELGMEMTRIETPWYLGDMKGR